MSKTDTISGLGISGSARIGVDGDPDVVASINPSNSSTIASVKLQTAADYDAVVERARSAGSSEREVQRAAQQHARCS